MFHEREKKLTADLELAREANEKQADEIERLKRFLHQREEDHNVSIGTSAEKSFKAGAAAVVDEMHDLWTSNEFAAEMMYGEIFE